MRLFNSAARQIKELHEAEEGLTQAVIKNASKEQEEEFFEAVRDQMNSLCEAIANSVNADSCALFFVTEEAESEAERCMIMRGAYGNLYRTLDIALKSTQRSEVRGYSYRSCLGEYREDEPEEKRRRVIARWSVTNQIWHLGEGRLANSNWAMDLLAVGPTMPRPPGEGDSKNYPNNGSLSSVFRCFLGIPIFVRGGKTLLLPHGLRRESPEMTMARREFLSRHRVIGILKVEGKGPQRSAELISEGDLLKNCLRRFQETPKSWQRLQDWFNKGRTVKDIERLFYVKAPEQLNPDEKELLNDGRKLLNEVNEDSESKKLDKDLVDFLAEQFQAQFTHEDQELLVFVAMQVGRILMRRTIEHAAKPPYNIVISENEVGILNIRHRDIKQLAALRTACEQLRLKVEHHLQTFRDELEHKRKQAIYRAQISHLIEPRGPIREVSSRLKEYSSLFRKLMNKQELLQGQEATTQLIFDNVTSILENCEGLSDRQMVLRGLTRIFADLSFSLQGLLQIRLQGNLGAEGAPQARLVQDDSSPPRARILRLKRDDEQDSPLVRRILHTYRVDDIGGVRVICDYLSDLFVTLDHLRARVGDWGLEFVKIDPAVEVAKGDGYRGVHVTLKADVRKLLAKEDVQQLEKALGLSKDDPIEAPCEIQIRTAYQHSWSLKSHNLSYKHEEKISQELRDTLAILSEQLYQADRLSDIVRRLIERMLLPDDYGEWQLLEYLHSRLSREALTLVEFGIQCAKKLHEKHLRPSGLPHFSHVMATCRKLVYNFGALDSEMIFLALLHDMWMRYGTQSGDREIGEVLQGDDISGVMRAFQDKLETTCEEILKHFGERISRERLQRFPTWFWVLMKTFRDYWSIPIEDRRRQKYQRLQTISSTLREYALPGSGVDLNDWLKRAYVLETAILLGEIEGLPDEWNRRRREQEYRSAYQQLEIIRHNLPSSQEKFEVLREADNVFREVAIKLGIEVPHWYR
ncbi:MAG: hypothetical protein ACE5PV_02530 [Candidatus Poribacteria bacterium]